MTTRDMVGASRGTWSVPEDVGRLCVAMFGAGKMAEVHLQTLTAMDGVQVTAICNPSSDAGARLARQFGIASVHRSIEQVLDTGVDAAIVAVSHGATVDVASRLLAEGIPCLIEKPAGFSSDQTRELAQHAAAGRSVAMVGLNRRFFSTVHQALLAVLHRGPVAGVSIEAHEPIVDYRTRAQFPGWLYDEWFIANSIHAIDLFRLVCGEPAAVEAFRSARSEPHGDSFTAALQFENGALGTFAAHWHAPRGVALRIFGAGVIAELSGLEQGFVRYEDGRRIKLRPDWADTRFKPGIYWQNAAFLQSVCDGVSPSFPASDLADNVRSMQLVEQIAGRMKPIFN